MLSLEKVDELLQASYQTLDIEEQKVELSRQDLVYQALEQKKLFSQLIKFFQR